MSGWFGPPVRRRAVAVASAAMVLMAGAARAQTTPETAATELSTLVVTATRTPEAQGQLPADLSVVTGGELRARDAHDMAAALALTPGVEAPAGGDAGPSSAVPSLWGLHEFDAFLLVVDGVPWGGAFNPMITTLDMNDIQRIEVLKGAAPVMFGATSFVGVVQAIHYPAGAAADEADIAFGSHGSARGWASFVAPRIGDYRQSIAIEGESLGFPDRREVVSDGKLLYRGALDAGAAKLTIDADLAFVRDTPPSPVIRAGAGLTGLTPVDANFNPANAAINQNEYHLAVGYERPTPLGDWTTLISLAHSDIRDIRGFLHPDLSGAADSQDQTRRIDETIWTATSPTTCPAVRT
jgi:outer membrane receptor protein involved in Fe transport